MRQDTLFIGKGALAARCMNSRKGKGEGLPRVLTMFKAAPLGIASKK